jgi:hypothetical protein
MMSLPTLLAVGGLGLDVVGAAIIALPDIPRANLVLWSARVRRGLSDMESNGLREGETGYSEIKDELENIYRLDFPDEVWAVRVGFYTMSRYGFESVYLFVDPEDEDEQKALGKELGLPVDYRVARETIQQKIDTWQAGVRGLGFLLLATGFLLQIVGNLI